MKIKHFKTFIAIAGLVISLGSTSNAQEEKERSRGGPEERPRRGSEQRPPRSESPGQSQANSLFQVLDRNRDGKLQQNEIDMAVVILRRMDQNKDGDVSQNEIKSLPRRPENSNQGRPDQQTPNQNRTSRRPSLETFDKDEDGKISKEEAPDRLKDRFDEVDKNSDGFIDKEEQTAMFEAFRKRFQQGQERQNRSNPNRPDPNAGQGRTERPRRPPVEKE
jgi:Ca2+-binding EF-hand superfamily protein